MIIRVLFANKNTNLVTHIRPSKKKIGDEAFFTPHACARGEVIGRVVVVSTKIAIFCRHLCDLLA